MIIELRTILSPPIENGLYSMGYFPNLSWIVVDFPCVFFDWFLPADKKYKVKPAAVLSCYGFHRPHIVSEYCRVRR